jgi:recombination protein RecT
VVVVAIAQNPDLFRADRRSLFMAAQKCAADGLLPDGRQAALVMYGDKVSFMPMVAGIRQRMRNSGEVLSAEAHVVYRNDRFTQKFGDDPAIVHEPPPFGVDRGDAVGAYAIIKLKNGEILREVLDKKEIEKIRAVSKSKNGPAWTNWWGEMARKAALRRCAKAAPTSADIDAMLARDDETDTAMPMVDVTPPEPEPSRGVSIEHRPEPARTYLVVDCDGEQHEFETAETAARVLEEVLQDAHRRGSSHVEAALEDNAVFIEEFGVPAHLAVTDLVQAHSPAGTQSGNSADQPQDSRKGTVVGATDRNARPPSAPVAQPPAGDSTMPDLLGGKERPPADADLQKYHIPLKRVPTENEQNRFDDRVNGWLADRVDPALIRAANEQNIENLRKCDPAYYQTLMARLGVRP